MLTWDLVKQLAPVDLTRSAWRQWRVRGVPYKMRLSILAWARENKRRIRIEEFDTLPLHIPRARKRNGRK